ncbi:GlxA family transcriptional regulator [Paroceanicella profunda]|uniref:GlxA family transcriptional regulator n=1 Tax=Paroceanicella profunda TaxID=2579971 RepID=A0A5B8FUE5_9RHOB|nr:GlxA family transcriptional regulator [Paroceanicella profunda]QDL90700.1 GlxA family transcriptional regulator [Paroceanicella profunda]
MSDAPKPKRFVFLILENATLLSFSCAIEPLRIANRVAGKVLYTWAVAAENGEAVTFSNGLRVTPDMGLEELDRDDILLVCGGTGVQGASTRAVLNWLRREARRGVALGGICTGSHAVARAGLLDGRRCTIHWENRDAFIEAFPEVELSANIYVIDGNRCSSAGGSASADMVLRMIAEAHGPDLAAQVADQMIYTTMRTDRDEQRLSIPTRIGVRHPKLASVIRLMEERIEEPESPADLAMAVGMSTRQLERLFRRYLDRSPKRYYMELRLQKARHLLLQTDMSVINVALACGFTSPSHFSKCYRACFSTTPYRERGTAQTGGTAPRADAPEGGRHVADRP